MLSTLGIKATAAPSSTSDIYQLASQFKREHGIKEPQFKETSPYTGIRQALQNSDTATAQKEYDALVKSMTTALVSKGQAKAKVDAYFDNYTKRPFTGSGNLETRFRSSLDRGQLDIYNNALKERSAISRLYRTLKK
jgi:hypothetical protein